MHIFSIGLTSNDLQKLTSILEPYAHFISLDFINIEAWLEKIHNPFPPAFLARFSQMVLVKYFLADLFPQYDKIIWTDVDVLFLDDPTLDFLTLNTSEPYYLHAVFTSEYRHALEGFWLCNLTYMRTHNWTQKVLDRIHTQQILNEPQLISFVWPNEIAQLPLKYCVFPAHYESRTIDYVHPNDLPFLQESLDRPIILHYCDFHGVPKPWDLPLSLKAGLWLEILLQTPFAHDFLQNWDCRQSFFIKETVYQFYFSNKYSTLTLVFVIPFKFLKSYLKAVKERLFSEGWRALAGRMKAKLLKYIVKARK
ncbi:glycosyltransferase [Helicobacter baculiformis]|uniref:glycosyltransferase n=1 Tax=Helicobacter baculiformis TaxID=427351 RepID=UPI000CF11A2F|nr:glycosyltransferase [Helicobacter baculiformis]